jgi:site-specific DNA recombinase
LKTALYIRVSTEEQAKEGHSIGAQQDRLMDYVRSQAWEVAEVYIDDGYSAKDLDRPAIQRLLKDCESKKFDVVLVYRLDRLVRSVLDLYEVMNHLDKHGVMFKSATEVYDTTSAMGRFFITLVAAIAQWERENLGERVKMGMEKNFRKGGWNGGEPPYGYRLEGGKLVVYEQEAALVRRIFELYKNHGQRYIAKLLNREGLRTRNGSMWSEYTVRYILENPVYSGRVRWNYRHFGGQKTGEEIIIDGEHERLITPEEQAEILTIAEKRLKNREKTHVCFPFTGTLKCARCGHTLHGGEKKQKRQNYRFYRCRGRFALGICNLPIIAEDTIEALVLEHINLMVTEEWKKDVVITQQEDKRLTDFETLDRELKAIHRRKQKWQMAFADDVISLDDLRARMKEENEKEEEIKRQMSELPDQGKDTSLSPLDVIAVARNIKDNWAHFEPEHRKLIIGTLFSEITIDAIGEAVGGPGRRVACKIMSVKTN